MELFKQDKQGLFYNRERGFYIENVDSNNFEDVEFLDYTEDVDDIIINRIKQLCED